jgi:hypothetical protein
VHITKIKSVNLDKWKPEMVEMYKHVNNSIINAYWEANLPAHYNKPGQGASSHEVESFIRDKYINKRWVDNGTDDPATLYWNDRKKFDKYIKKITSGETGGAPAAESDDEKKKKKKSKKSKKSKKDSEDEESSEEIVASKGLKAPISIQAPVS